VIKTTKIRTTMYWKQTANGAVTRAEETGIAKTG